MAKLDERTTTLLEEHGALLQQAEEKQAQHRATGGPRATLLVGIEEMKSVVGYLELQKLEEERKEQKETKDEAQQDDAGRQAAGAQQQGQKHDEDISSFA